MDDLKNDIIHIIKKDKCIMYKEINELLASNNLTLLVILNMLTDTKMYIQQEEKSSMTGLYTHTFDNAHSDLYYIVSTIIKCVAKMNIDITSGNNVDIKTISSCGDFFVLHEKYHKLLKLHKTTVNDMYENIETLYDTSFLHTLESVSHTINKLSTYEVNISTNTDNSKSKVIFKKKDMINTLFPLYNYPTGMQDIYIH